MNLIMSLSQGIQALCSQNLVLICGHKYVTGITVTQLLVHGLGYMGNWLARPVASRNHLFQRAHLTN